MIIIARIVVTPSPSPRPRVGKYIDRFDRATARRLCLSKIAREESMERTVIYHNPVCGNSRGAMQRLRDRNAEFEIIEYLKAPPDRAALEKILAMVENPPADLVRKDKRFEELKLKAENYTSKDQVIALLLKHPELMQRPVVIHGKRAVIARPPEKLDALF
jgi:arsenate reductase